LGITQTPHTIICGAGLLSDTSTRSRPMEGGKKDYECGANKRGKKTWALMTPIVWGSSSVLQTVGGLVEFNSVKNGRVGIWGAGGG